MPTKESDRRECGAEETGWQSGKGTLELVRADEVTSEPAHRINFFELAYQRIEDLLVSCELKPGRFLTVRNCRR